MWRRGQAEIDWRHPVPGVRLDDAMEHLPHILEVAGAARVGNSACWEGVGSAEVEASRGWRPSCNSPNH